jgi:hypothetical protein
MTRQVQQLFRGSRWFNMARHARKGTLMTHLARKWFIKQLCKLIPF